MFEAIDSLDSGPALDRALIIAGETIVEAIESKRPHCEEISAWLSRLDKCAGAADRCETLASVAAALAREPESNNLMNSISALTLDEFGCIKKSARQIHHRV